MPLPVLKLAAAAMLVGSPLAEERLRRTPFGPRPPECVFSAPHGSTILEGLDGQLLLHAPGAAEPSLVPVPESCHAYEAARRESLERSSGSPPGAVQHGLVPDGWLSNAGVYYTEYSAKLREVHKFTGLFTVPPAPPSPYESETVYYFIGLEDTSMGAQVSIHQPVLTWGGGDETEGGNGGWYLWSWTCCPQNVTWHSEDIAGFVPGDTVYGRIEKTADATWTIDGAFKDGSGHWHNTTLVSQVGNYNYNYADVTLEVYGVTSCDQMPYGASDFTELEISLSDGSSWVSPNWHVTGSTSDCQVGTTVHDARTISISTNVGAAAALVV